MTALLDSVADAMLTMTEIQFPKISVVTPSFNQGRYIRETIESVLSQDYPNLEYIVIDGGSTDSTLTVIDDYVDRLDYFVSEKDKGQSHAINKGFSQATGDIFCWLNSDDQFAPNALWSMAIAFYTNNSDMVAGICEVHENGKLIHRHMTSCGDGKLPLDDILDLDNGWNAGQFFYQPEVFFTKELWERAGGYVREDYFYSMDYELWCRFAYAGANMSVIGTPIVNFRTHSEQKTADPDKFKSELIQVRDQFCRDHGIHWSASERPAVNWGKKLQVAFVNDLGYLYGAGIAQMRIAAAFELAGHEIAVFDLASSRRGVENLELIDLIQQFSPDLVILGNLHAAEKTLPNLVLELESSYPCFWLTHDFWILTGRCAYTADCPRLLTGCNSDCPTTDEYPVIEKDQINPAWIEKRVFLARASKFTILANSTWAENFVARALQTVTNSIPLHKIRLGVPADVFRQMDKLDCKQKLGIERDRFTLMFSASSLSDKRKGGQLLSDALGMINLDNIALIVIGRLDQDLNLSGIQLVKLGYVGNVKEMVIALNAADLFVGPSVEETFGQVFIEAAMCGTPSLGFDVTGVKDSIKQGITGHRLEVISAECLASGITEMYNNAQALSRISQLAPLYARNAFSLEASYGSFFSVLEKMGLVDKTGIPHKISFAERSDIIDLASRGWSDWSLKEKFMYTANKNLYALADRMPKGLRKTIGKVMPRRFKQWLISRK
jgi:glycosyltransferase involved in cell wall biosynthesis